MNNKKIYIISSTIRYVQLEDFLSNINKIFLWYDLNFYYRDIYWIWKKIVKNETNYENIFFYTDYKKYIKSILESKSSIIIFYEAYDNLENIDFTDYKVIIFWNIFKLFERNNINWISNKLLNFKWLYSIHTFTFSKVIDNKSINKVIFWVDKVLEIYKSWLPKNLKNNFFLTNNYKFDFCIVLWNDIDYEILDKFISDYKKFNILIIWDYIWKIKIFNSNVKIIPIIDTVKLAYLISISKIYFIPIKIRKKKSKKYLKNNFDFNINSNEYVRLSDGLSLWKIILTSDFFLTNDMKNISYLYSSYDDLKIKIKILIEDKELMSISNYKKIIKFYYSNFSMEKYTLELYNFINNY